MEQKRKTRTAESNSRADPHPKKVIPYKEYAAHKEAEGRVSTADKLTLEEEENWDEEPLLPPHKTPPGAKPMAPSQEDERKLMVDQDPRSGSVAGILGMEQWQQLGKMSPLTALKNLLGLRVESMKVSPLSISL